MESGLMGVTATMGLMRGLMRPAVKKRSPSKNAPSFEGLKRSAYAVLSAVWSPSFAYLVFPG